MRARSVAQVVHAAPHDMGPFTVRQPLPSAELPYFDPFVLLHHAPPAVMTGDDRVSWHPHRGFAPVTFIFKGGIRHRDTLGNDRTVTAGGTQWMHAGSGLLHDETPLPGEVEIIQLWINSPASRKMAPPAYRPLSVEETPRFGSDDGCVEVRVVAGELEGVTGPIPPLTPLNAATVTAGRGGRIGIALPRDHRAAIYLLDGALGFGGTTVAGLHLAVFDDEGDAIGFEAVEDTRALLLSGAPIGERIVSYGPFVMNSDEEIRQAFRDFRDGAMGRAPAG